MKNQKVAFEERAYAFYNYHKKYDKSYSNTKKHRRYKKQNISDEEKAKRIALYKNETIMHSYSLTCKCGKNSRDVTNNVYKCECGRIYTHYWDQLEDRYDLEMEEPK